MDKLQEKRNSDEKSTRQKILIIVYYWPPSGGAGVQRWVKLTKYLARMGLNVFVVTVDENYASYLQIDRSLVNDVSSDIHVIKTKSFEAINIFARIFGKKKVPTAGFYNLDKKSFSQTLGMVVRSNLFIPDPRRAWNRFAYREAKKLIRQEKIKTVITSSPPHSSQLIGLKLKRKLQIRWIADLRDPWTDIYYYDILRHSYISKWIDKLYEHKVLISADRIFTVSQHLKDLFASKDPSFDKGKINVIPNGYDHEDFPSEPVGRKGNIFTISYIGSITDQYKPEVFLEAFKRLAENHPGKVRFRMIGPVSKNVLNAIEVLGIRDFVETLPAMPHNKAVHQMASADALLLLIPDVENAKLILTGKLFEYLATGNPIILVGPEVGDAAKIIHECQAGECFDRSSMNSILDYLEELWILYQEEALPRTSKPLIKKYSRKEQAVKIKELIGR